MKNLICNFYNQRTIVVDNKIYKNIEVEIVYTAKHYKFVEFYSKNRVVAKLFLEGSFSKAVNLPHDVLEELFRHDIRNQKSHFITRMALLKKEAYENRKLLIKGLSVVLLIFIIPLLLVLVFIL